MVKLKLSGQGVQGVHSGRREGGGQWSCGKCCTIKVIVNVKEK